MRKLLSLCLLITGLSSLASGATILIVRHADRDATSMSPDVPLNAAGEERARILAEVLGDAQVRRIYVTQVKRTQQTAEPLAARLHLKPVVISNKEVDALVSQLRALNEDETVLVVGHADTVPQVVQKLGGGSVPALGENEYDRLTILTTSGTGKPHVLTLRYGKAAH